MAWTPGGVHGILLESIESRWSPGGIQLEFVKMKKKHLFDKLKWILRSRKLIYHAYI